VGDVAGMLKAPVLAVFAAEHRALAEELHHW
jgi:hypothetical protein